MAAWRSPSRSSAAARGGTLGSMAAWAGSRAGAAEPARSTASATRTAARTQGEAVVVAGGRADMYLNNANGLRSWLGPVSLGPVGRGFPGLQWNVPVLPRVIPFPLATEGPQGIDEAWTGVPRVDDVVDVPAR